ncbi:MAG: DUF1697 domain-containing protein [Gemmatimonadaceae bacterium]|nr:DUF1697 domain-containing protein [Gemmatimonadaceae bacterium]
MQRYIALLSGIPVGSKGVSADKLRLLLDRLNLFDVEVLPGTGNVAFRIAVGKLAPLEAQISRHLMRALRYDIAAFIRTPAELSAIVERDPFPPNDAYSGEVAVFIVFLADHADERLKRQLRGFRTEADDFRVVGREIYWLRRLAMPSKVTGPVLQRLLGRPATLRSLESVQKLAEEG